MFQTLPNKLRLVMTRWLWLAHKDIFVILAVWWLTMPSTKEWTRSLIGRQRFCSVTLFVRGCLLKWIHVRSPNIWSLNKQAVPTSCLFVSVNKMTAWSQHASCSMGDVFENKSGNDWLNLHLCAYVCCLTSRRLTTSLKSSVLLLILLRDTLSPRS